MKWKNDMAKDKEQRKEKQKQQDKKNIYIIILSVLIVLLIGVLGFLIYTMHSQKEAEKDKHASAYVSPDASEWDDGLDAPADIQGKILVPGYTAAQMKAGDTTLELSIGNPKENTCYLKATLQLEDGTVLYESDLLKPGTGYKQITLKQTLEAGSYQAIVKYQGYTMDNKSELNSCDSAFTLTVIQ